MTCLGVGTHGPPKWRNRGPTKPDPRARKAADRSPARGRGICDSQKEDRSNQSSVISRKAETGDGSHIWQPLRFTGRGSVSLATTRRAGSRGQLLKERIEL